MPQFDFDQSSAPDFGSTSNTNNLSVFATLSDTANDTMGTVTFTVSYNLQFSQPGPAINNISATIADITGAGLSFFYSASTVSLGSTISAASASISFALSGATIGGATGLTGTATLVTTGGDSFNAVASGNSVVFTISNPVTAFQVSSLNVNFTCFCAGTRIATPDGTSLVEDLQPGDTVRLADGRDVTVRWIGRQPVDITRSNPHEANPIRITRGAFGDGLPERDLRVSPDHAIALDGYLINAGALVNGTTIYQERNVSENFTYYHIETDAHELILAEGVAAETFVDYTDRDAFENADEAPDRVIPEMPLPRISAARMVPAHIRDRLRPLIAAE